MKHPGNLGIMKRPYLRIPEIEEGQESQLQGPENTFNQFIEDNLKKRMPIGIQEAYRIPIRLDKKRKSSYHIIIKTQNLPNK